MLTHLLPISSIAAALLCGALASDALGQAGNEKQPQHTNLERMLKHRGTRSIQATEVGRIESSDASAVVTAVTTALAGAIGRALAEFGLEDRIPEPEKIQLPAADVEEIKNSAVRNFPVLASSPRIKAAQYMSRDSKDAAWAVFWPYERTGEFGRSLAVDCHATGSGWECDESKARGYLSVPGRDAEIVITGPLGRDKALALIDFAKRMLREQSDYAEADGWYVAWIRPPDEHIETYLVVLRDGLGVDVSMAIEESGQDGEGFEVVRVTGSDEFDCGG